LYQVFCIAALNVLPFLSSTGTSHWFWYLMQFVSTLSYCPLDLSHWNQHSNIRGLYETCKKSLKMMRKFKLGQCCKVVIVWNNMGVPWKVLFESCVDYVVLDRIHDIQDIKTCNLGWSPTWCTKFLFIYI